ncbi:hypothetical protein BGW37DRAFT_450029 [Umbelopsis sp. PMI_123]|nr:hypothetical protein BGW37DRAFT_450029 [Umbelopsis sp. PMI_123]
MHTVQWPALNAHLRAHDLELVDDESKYRKIVALKSLKRGSVAIESQPLASVPLPTARAEICNHCFRRSTRTAPLQRCSRCQSAFFCSKHCFQKAWFAYHQYVCKSDQSAAESENDQDQDTLDEVMLERVLITVARAKKHIRQQQHTPEDLSQCAQLEAFSSLMAHETKQPDQLLDRFKQIATNVLQKPHIKALGVDPATLLIYLCRFHCNNFGVVDNQLFTIGEGTYPIGSLFNHSCRPNAVALYNGTTQMIRLIEDVSPGEEITIAYIDVANTRTDRTQKLAEKYFFRCDCPRCSSDTGFGLVDTLLGESSDEDMDEVDPSFVERTLMEDIEAWNVLDMAKKYPPGSEVPMTPGNALDVPRYVHLMGTMMFPRLHYVQRSPKVELFETPQTKEMYESILFKAALSVLHYPVVKKSESNEIFKPYSLKTLKTATRCLNIQMMKNHWPQSSRLCMLILVHYMFIYPRYHPMLAIHCVLTAKAAWNALVQLELTGINRKLEKEFQRGVQRWIKLAKETVSCNFGEQGEHWREIIELEWIFKRDQKLK